MSEFQIMDKRDESQILAELQGQFLKHFVYKFKVGGREVTGISWSGIKEIAYRLEGIDTFIETTAHDEDNYTFIVKAINKNIDSSRLGVGSCKKSESFAIQKALSKAQRNAIRGVIPEKTIELFLSEFLGNKDHTDTIPDADEMRKEVEISFTERHDEELDLSVDGIRSYFAHLGYKADKFVIRHDEPTRQFVLDKIPSIPKDEWQTYLNDVREMGGEYNQEYKKTVFRY